MESIVVVEDDPDHAAKLVACLNSSHVDVIDVEADLERVLAAANEARYDLALVVPSCWGDQHEAGIVALSSAAPDLAILVLADAHVDGGRYLRAGAHYDLLKSEVSDVRLRRAMERARIGAELGVRASDTIGELRAHVATLESTLADSSEFEDLITLVAHDLRAPLRTARVYLDKAASEPAAAKRWLRRADASLESIDEMSEALVRYGRLELSRSGRSPANLGHVEVPIRVSLAPDLGRATLDWAAEGVVKCDQAMLEAILVELVRNSVGHADLDQAPRVRVESQPLHNRGASTAQIRVVDNGQGIAPRHWEDAFKPLERLTERGSGLGLGLATARKLAHLNGGHLAIESSAPGAGTTVLLTLPAA